MLNEQQAEFVKKYFTEKVYPVLSPIILSNVDDFPYLKDKSIYLAIILKSSLPDKKKDYALIEVLPTYFQIHCIAFSH
jgi:polyphosphate kinase